MTIITYLKLDEKITEHKHNRLSEALAFATSQEVGTQFQIKENGKLLAKGKIENYKETFNEKKLWG